MEDIARETKIRVSFLQAIEEDRFDLLPGGVFTRNFLRAYARCLGMDEEGVVESYVQLHPPSEEKKVAPSLLVVEELKRGRRSFYYIVILIVLILLLGYLLWVKGWGFRGENNYNPQQGEKPAATEQQTAVPPPESWEVLSTAEEPSAEEAGLSMELIAVDSCWVEVLADNELVAYQLLQPGEKLTLIDHQRFSITLGNAGGVEITLNGKRLRPMGILGEVKRGLVLDAENWRQYAIEDN